MRRFGEINIYEILSSKDAAEPIGPTLFAGPFMTPGKVNYFYKILKSTKKNHKIRKLFWYCFSLYDEKMVIDKATV